MKPWPTNCYHCDDLGQRPLYSLNGFTVFTCDRCGFARVFPVPAEADLRAQYSGETDDIATGAAAHEIRAFADDPSQGLKILERSRFEPLRRAGVRLDSETVLVDVGCGGGAFLAALKHLGYTKIYGIDFNADSVRLIRERLGIRAYVGQVERRPELPAADVVTCFDVLEHVADPARALEELKEMLRPGGVVHLRVPNFGSLYSKLLGAHWLWAIPPFHLNYFTPSVLRELVVEAGLRVESCSTGESGYRLAFFYLQGQKIARNRVEIGAPRPRAYSKLSFRAINLAEGLLRRALAPYFALLKWQDWDDCITVIARRP